MEPAASIIDRLGGPRAVADAIGVYRTRVYSWMYTKDRGGTGGLVPQKHHVALLDLAQSKGVNLEPADFLPVRADRVEAA